MHYVKSVQVRENTDQKKLRIWTLFTQWSGTIESKDKYDLNF